MDSIEEPSLSHDDRPIKGSSMTMEDEYPPAEPFVEEGDRPITAKPSQFSAQFSEADAFGGPEIKGKADELVNYDMNCFIILSYLIIHNVKRMLLRRSTTVLWMCAWRIKIGRPV